MVCQRYIAYNPQGKLMVNTDSDSAGGCHQNLIECVEYEGDSIQDLIDMGYVISVYPEEKM
jgi:hypothetical protein